MEKAMFFLLLMIVLAGMVGCTLIISDYLNPKALVISEINQSLIISTLNGQTCPSRVIRLTTTIGANIGPRVENACGGSRVQAYESTQIDGMNYYHVVTVDGKRGWINSSYISTPICASNEDCKALERFQALPVCDAGVCVECLGTRDCSGVDVCKISTRSCVRCMTNEDCDAATASVCNSNNECVTCLNDAQCASGFCNNETYKCVQCRDNYDCNETEYCYSGSCRPRV